jgi:hypothetical protein
MLVSIPVSASLSTGSTPTSGLLREDPGEEDLLVPPPPPKFITFHAYWSSVNGTRDIGVYLGIYLLFKRIMHI